MKLKNWICALILPLAALPSIAQQQQQDQDQMPKLVETVDVRVINIDVVVTDRKGRPVTGLTKDDFELFESGKQRTLTNFYEINRNETRKPSLKAKGAPQPSTTEIDETAPEARTRRFILYIDNLSLSPFNRNTVIKHMTKFVDETMEAGDQAMIATWNRSMKIRVPFTTDKVQLKQTLEAIKGESGLGVQAISERRQVEQQIRDARSYQDAIQVARTYASSVDHDMRQSVTAINGLMTTLAGVEGKKILVLTSEGFPIQPGKEMFYFIDDMAREHTDWQSYGSSLIQSTSFDGANLIQSIAKTANANGITVYTIHAGGLGAYSTVSAEERSPVSFAVQQAALSNSTDSLRLMADLTGGSSTTGTGNFASAFNRIEQDLNNYYSLGYRSGTERVDRQRDILVRTKNRDYVVRSRRSFVEKSVPTEMGDKVVANLFYDSDENDLDINIRTGRPVLQDDNIFKVPVEVYIPMEKLTLIPQGEIIAGGFSVYVVVANQAGDMSDVQHQSHPLRIPPEDLKEIEGKHYTYTLDLLMEKGRNRISIGVVDEVSNETGFMRQEILAADLR